MRVQIIAEIGLNHNGEMATAKRLIDVAKWAGANAVKFQKRTPEVCVPPDQWSAPRQTPWGQMPYIEYRRRMEFSEDQYAEIAEYCARRHVDWSVSVWDEPAVLSMAPFGLRWLKIPSAKVTDHGLLASLPDVRVLASTGMTTDAELDAAVRVLSRARSDSRLTLLHCHSAYPAPTAELNLRAIQTLQKRYGVPVGYSGHEYGIRHVLAAVALGATVLERHITLDHEMWGTDHRSSVEPLAFAEMVRHVRSVEAALGDGVRRVWASEEPARTKLRGQGIAQFRGAA